MHVPFVTISALALPWELPGGWHLAGSAFLGCIWIPIPDPLPASVFQNQGLVGFPSPHLHVPLRRHADLVSLHPQDLACLCRASLADGAFALCALTHSCIPPHEHYAIIISSVHSSAGPSTPNQSSHQHLSEAGSTAQVSVG